jgi:hypothetical protein
MRDVIAIALEDAGAQTELPNCPSAGLGINAHLAAAIEHILAFDWSDNDDDAVAAIRKLREIVHPENYRCGGLKLE